MTDQAIEIVLPIEGMTCASCVNRIERFLTKTPGVERAAVNLATERATVTVDPGIAGRDELVRAVEAAGYDVRPEATAAEAGASAAQGLAAELTADDLERERFQRKTLIQAVAAIVTALGIMLVMFLPQTAVGLETLNKLVLWPATFIQFWAGGRFYRAAWRAGRHGSTTMDTLVAVGTTAAWGYSMVVTLWPELVVSAGRMPESYFDTLGDHHRPDPARALARGAGEGPDDRRDPPRSMALQATTARRRPRRRGGGRRPRDRRAPATWCASAPARRCRSTASSSRARRRSTSRCSRASRAGRQGRRRRGHRRHAQHAPGSFVMRATRVGRDTALAQIVALVEEAQGSKAPIQRLADRIGEVFVPLVLVVAAFTFVAWLLLGPGAARSRSRSRPSSRSLIIACPCALGLATPTAIMVGTGKGRRGRDPDPRRRGARGGRSRRRRRPRQDRHADRGPAARSSAVVAGARLHADRACCDLAAVAERGSEHPLGEAIVRDARETRARAPRGRRRSRRSPGGASTATVDGPAVVVGSRAPDGRARRRPRGPRRAGARPPRRDGGTRRVRRGRRRGRRADRDRRHGQARVGRGRRGAPRRRRSRSGCSPATTARPPRPSPARSASATT